MTLKGAALHELKNDPRFPTPWILAHWVHGADKAALLHAMKHRTWPITRTYWLSEDEQLAIRRRATILALVEQREALVS